MEEVIKEAMILEHGKISVVESKISAASLDENELLVRFDSAPVNPSDYYHVYGKYSSVKTTPPYRLGFEGMGVIEQVGSGIDKQIIGKYCLFGSYKGTYATK